jgi:hypothetical protein
MAKGWGVNPELLAKEWGSTLILICFVLWLSQ